MTGIELLEKAKRLKAIANVGLLYGTNEYDRERYLEIQDISLLILSGISGHDAIALHPTFPAVPDYPTAKVDVRGLLLSPDKKVLLVQESADGKWSLPGGWADVGFTPKEVMVTEFKDETGLHVEPQRLLAIFDKRMHPHPPQPFYVYKLVFYCEAQSTSIIKGFDVQDVQYFAIDAFPPLSEDRILKSQIQMLYEKVVSGNSDVYVD